jgi:hypothetical protein
MSMPEHIVRSDSSQRHAEIRNQFQTDVSNCREDTHLGEYADVTPLQQPIVVRDHLHHFSNCRGDERWRLVEQHLEELLPVVPDDCNLVMTTGKQLSWVLVDVLLVESLGLTKPSGIFHSYGQLQIFLLAFPDMFIIGNNMRRDRQWLRTWGVARPRSPNMSVFTASSWIEVDRHSQPVETWCMMVSIIGHVIARFVGRV